jgi:hypothetical protein
VHRKEWEKTREKLSSEIKYLELEEVANHSTVELCPEFITESQPPRVTFISRLRMRLRLNLCLSRAARGKYVKMTGILYY